MSGERRHRTWPGPPRHPLWRRGRAWGAGSADAAGGDGRFDGRAHHASRQRGREERNGVVTAETVYHGHSATTGVRVSGRHRQHVPVTNQWTQYRCGWHQSVSLANGALHDGRSYILQSTIDVLRSCRRASSHSGAKLNGVEGMIEPSPRFAPSKGPPRSDKPYTERFSCRSRLNWGDPCFPRSFCKESGLSSA